MGGAPAPVGRPAGSFWTRQPVGTAQLVVLIDPDGTAGDWTYVVVDHPTGVAYAQQYGGTANRQGELEGYLVPVDGSSALITLRDVFERELGGTGVWSRGSQLPGELLERVAGAVEGIRYWPTGEGRRTTCGSIGPA